MRRNAILIFVALALVAVMVLLLRRSNEEPEAESPKAFQARTNPAPKRETAAAVTEPETNSVEVAPEIIAEVNRLVVAATPLGVKGPVTQKDFISRVDYPKGEVVLQTKTHTMAVSRNRLYKFVSERESSNPVAEPEAKREAMQQWYKATGKWSKEEALAETQRIIERLGIQTQWETREVEATEFTMKNPQGEAVKVTPFYIVKFGASNGMLRAEFRVGEAGPGRLTDWSLWPPMPVKH